MDVDGAYDARKLNNVGQTKRASRQTYVEWERDYEQCEARVLKKHKKSGEHQHQYPHVGLGDKETPHETWTNDEIYAWAKRIPKMKRWMEITWWTPLTPVDTKTTDNFSSTMAFCNIGDVTYTVLFMLGIPQIRIMCSADRYWRTFSRYAIRDIRRHGYQWIPPENYF